MRPPTAPASVRPSADRPAAVAAGVLGLLGGVATVAFGWLAVALGGLSADDGSVEWWLYPLLVLGAVQVWAAVQLLRRRGRLLLAVAGLLGSLWLVALLADGGLTLPAVLAVLPVIAGLLALTPPVRRWADAGPVSPAG